MILYNILLTHVKYFLSKLQLKLLIGPASSKGKTDPPEVDLGPTVVFFDEQFELPAQCHPLLNKVKQIRGLAHADNVPSLLILMR